MKILVLNAGSSSLKYTLFKDGRELFRGMVAHIGEASGPKSHMEALKIAQKKIKESGAVETFERLDGVGHRVVHGGERFTEPTLVDETLIEELKELIPLAPLHNPANIEGIVTMGKIAPKIPQVAVFDTAFHQSMTKAAFLYAIPIEFYREHGVRRYGFHGTSHHYVAKEAAKLLKRPLEELNIITLHLGNGASACAIEGGKSVETSMGFTPLEGLVMGTRCGDLDPEIPLFLQEIGADVKDVLNYKSGLKGLCGSNDMRQVQKLAESGDEQAAVAIEIFTRRVKKYIGAYSALLGRVDALVFTAGIGEKSAYVRRLCCSGLDWLGFELDERENSKNSRVVSTEGSRVKILVIPTDEELEIALQTEAVLRDDRL